MAGKLKQDLEIGSDFDDLVVDSLKFTKDKKTYVWCKCSCGKRLEVRTDHLKPKQIIRSCGCKKNYYTSKNHNKWKGSLAKEGLKKCARCRDYKPLEEYSFKKSSKDKLYHTCKSCKSELARWSHVKNKYGLSKDEYDEMKGSENKCYCCKKVYDGVLVIDHCHKTGIVRGLLCNSCNWGIGHLGDDLTGVQKAVDYLTDFQNKVKNDYRREETGR